MIAVGGCLPLRTNCDLTSGLNSDTAVAPSGPGHHDVLATLAIVVAVDRRIGVPGRSAPARVGLELPVKTIGRRDHHVVGQIGFHALAGDDFVEVAVRVVPGSLGRRPAALHGIELEAFTVGRHRIEIHRSAVR